MRSASTGLMPCDLTEIRWALLFHDAIYDARRNDNEARSADWACRVMQELQRPDDEIARVRNMILRNCACGEGRDARRSAAARHRPFDPGRR